MNRLTKQITSPSKFIGLILRLRCEASKSKPPCDRRACLPLARKLTPYAVAQRATSFRPRIKAIQQTLQCPCPSKDGLKQFERDEVRRKSFGLRRASREILTRAEDIEEARVTARFGSFWHGSEMAARPRLA